jgi:hypothetical protein
MHFDKFSFGTLRIDGSTYGGQTYLELIWGPNWR